MVNTCQPHRVHIVALVQVKYLLCAKATTRECVGRVAEREKLLARKLPVLQYMKRHIVPSFPLLDIKGNGEAIGG